MLVSSALQSGLQAAARVSAGTSTEGRVQAADGPAGPLDQLPQRVHAQALSPAGSLRASAAARVPRQVRRQSDVQE